MCGVEGRGILLYVGGGTWYCFVWGWSDVVLFCVMVERRGIVLCACGEVWNCLVCVCVWSGGMW